MAKHLAVLNPAAGGGACGKRAPAALERLRAAGLEIEVVPTRARGEGDHIARAAYAAGQRDFIAIGGDGTGYELINGLYGEHTPADRPAEDIPRLGLLPLGTGNSFLRDFSDRGAEYAIESLIAGRTRPCDVIRLIHDAGVLHFINIFSIGFVSDVCALRNERFATFGELGYVLGVITKTAALHSYTFPMRVDGGPEDRAPLTFLSVNNSRFTGGKMEMAPAADTCDGLLDIIRVGQLSRLSLLQTFPKIFKGTHIHHPAVRATQARAIDFEIPEELIDVMLDGEMLKLRPRRLEVLPSALIIRA